MKNYGQNIMLLLFTLILSFIVIGIITELIVSPPVEELGLCDTIYHHQMVPYGQSYFSKFEYNMNYSINSLGFRDYEYPVKKCQDCFRIIMLGDSFTEGTGIEQLEDTFPKLMETSLSTKSSKRIEILNFGRISYSPVLEYLILKNIGLNYDPDVIIVNFDVSDVAQDFNYLTNARYSKEGEFLGINGCEKNEREQETVFQLRNFLLSLDIVTILESSFRNLILYTVQELPLVSIPPESDSLLITREEFAESDLVMKQWNVSQLYLHKIIDLAKTNNKTIIITTYPWGHQVDNSTWKQGRKVFGYDTNTTYSLEPQRRVQLICQKQNISCYDFTQDLREGGEGVYYNYDPHWTPKGAKIVARALEQQLISSTIIPMNPK